MAKMTGTLKDGIVGTGGHTGFELRDVVVEIDPKIEGDLKPLVGKEVVAHGEFRTYPRTERGECSVFVVWGFSYDDGAGGGVKGEVSSTTTAK